MNFSPASSIQQLEFSTSDVEHAVCEHLAPACDGMDTGFAVTSLITYACLLLKPDIEFAQLKTTVMDVSASLVMALAEPASLGQAH